MPDRLKFNVFGKLMIAESSHDGWRLFDLGADGKRMPANIVIPDFVQGHEIEQYLDDVFHELATPARPSVTRIPPLESPFPLERTMKMTYIGGPTSLLEFGGVRLLTDPTFDPAGGEYRAAAYSLYKTQDPAVPREAIGQVDAVLLSHDHHFDNLDTSGRAMLYGVDAVLTTDAGATRLGPPAKGLAPWQTHDLVAPDGAALHITATPARHGPPNGDRGPCIGFVLHRDDGAGGVVYFSGDTVWYEGVAEVARRFPVTVAILNMGAARVAAAGPSHLTFTAMEGVEFARAFPDATIVPLHFEGWSHFSETRTEIEQAFRAAGLERRLQWLPPGAATTITGSANR